VPATAPIERSAPRSGSLAEPLLVLLHIPKTAGMTLAGILQYVYGDAFRGGVGESRFLPDSRRMPNVFSRPEHVEGRLRSLRKKGTVRALSGHLTLGWADRLPANSRWVTVLRDPVERTLSQYYYFVDPPSRRSGRPGAGFVPPWLPAPSPSLTLDEALTERGYIPPNLQTRMICGLVSPYDPLPDGALEQAKRNLDERFAYIGTTERFTEFLALLNLELGWPTVAYRRSNTNPKRPKQEDLPAETRRLVEERNELDRELHAHAVSMLERAFSRRGAVLAEEAEVLRLAEQRRRSKETRDPRSLPVEARVELALREGELAEARLQTRRAKSKARYRPERRPWSRWLAR
jgi:galactose-3-O-sulfotransferase